MITRAELFAGVFDEEEQAKVETLLSVFRVYDVTARVAEQGEYFKRDFRPSHGTELADALIAGTAEVHDAQLVTLNVKHFPMLDDVIVPNGTTCQITLAPPEGVL